MQMTTVKDRLGTPSAEAGGHEPHERQLPASIVAPSLEDRDKLEVCLAYWGFCRHGRTRRRSLDTMPDLRPPTPNHSGAKPFIGGAALSQRIGGMSGNEQAEANSPSLFRRPRGI